jgi:AraC-like DNA-binding protein
MNWIASKVRINRANRNQCAPEWLLDSAKQGWTDFTLWLIRQGGGRVESRAGQQPFREGACLLFRPHEHYVIRSDPRERPVLAISVHFESLDETGQAVRPAEESLPALYRQVTGLVFLWEVLGRCVSAWRQHGTASRAEAELWLQAALAELDRQDRRPVHRGREQERSELIEQMCSDIMENPGAPHTVEAMARQLGCSRYHFSRTFRGIKGVSPQEFILGARIEAAKSLLQDFSHPVWRIAELLGYRDTYFFSRQFRQKAGVPPTAYREGRR